jgi:serine phosphatase RsbU (regulator of sigma subunit)
MSFLLREVPEVGTFFIANTSSGDPLNPTTTEISDLLIRQTVSSVRTARLHAQTRQHLREMTESLQHALRIQQSLMPDTSPLTKPGMLSAFWANLRPLNIVSGDFYWSAVRDRRVIYIAACDCTGHGVPGSFMSVLGINLLNTALTEGFMQTPPVRMMLSQVREELVRHFTKAGGGSSGILDGMDIALVRIDLQKMSLDFGGANRPLILFRKAENYAIPHLLPYSHQSISVQILGEPQPFESIVRDIERGDRIYLFSDGVTDQFSAPTEGRKSGKKLSRRKFISWLQEIQHLSLEDQHPELESRMHTWMGGTEQTDDMVLVAAEI